MILNVNTQSYYFYYIELFKPKKSNDTLYILFNNNTKYIKKIPEKEHISGLDIIKKKIEKKLENFHQYSDDKDIIENFNLTDILLFLKGIINKKIQLDNLLKIISCCPLKYFVIDINSDDNSFIVRPIFPYMELYILEHIKKEDSENYFIDEKYNILSYLSNKVKGEYFEYSSKQGLKNIIKESYKSIEEISVDQIATMNKITVPYEYFISKLKKENLSIEEEEVKDKNIDDEYEDVNEVINVDLESQINYDEIKNKINDYYKKDLNDFDIFYQKKTENENDELKEKLISFGMESDYIENVLFKEINDYRIEEFEKRVNKRFEEIKKVIENKKKNNKKKKSKSKNKSKEKKIKKRKEK